MKSKLTALAAGIALAAGVSTAGAEDLYVLGAEEMDQVTAGLAFDLTFSFGFTIGASLFDDVPGYGEDAVVTDISINDTRPGVDPTTGSAFTATIQSSSIGIRGHTRNFQRSGSLTTTWVNN